jgi:predicted nucleic acid-binding Zn ribbon protein
MPLYTYIHPNTEETIDIVQSVHDEHVQFGLLPVQAP